MRPPHPVPVYATIFTSSRLGTRPSSAVASNESGYEWSGREGVRRPLLLEKWARGAMEESFWQYPWVEEKGQRQVWDVEYRGKINKKDTGERLGLGGEMGCHRCKHLLWVSWVPYMMPAIPICAARRRRSSVLAAGWRGE